MCVKLYTDNAYDVPTFVLSRYPMSSIMLHLSGFVTHQTNAWLCKTDRCASSCLKLAYYCNRIFCSCKHCDESIWFKTSPNLAGLIKEFSITNYVNNDQYFTVQVMEKDPLRAAGKLSSEFLYNSRAQQADPFNGEVFSSDIDPESTTESTHREASHECFNDTFDLSGASDISQDLKTKNPDLATAFNAAEESLLTFDFTDWLRDQNMISEGSDDELLRLPSDLEVVEPSKITPTKMLPLELRKNGYDDRNQTSDKAIKGLRLVPAEMRKFGDTKSIGAQMSKSDEKQSVGSDLLLIMEVCLPEGKSETLYIHEHEDPFETALDFCCRHNLGPDSSYKLANQIMSQMTMLKSEKEGDNNDNLKVDIQIVRNEVNRPTENSASKLKKDSPNSKLTKVTENKSLETGEGDDESRYNALLQQYGHYTHRTGNLVSGKQSDTGCMVNNEKEILLYRMSHENRPPTQVNTFPPSLYTGVKSTLQSMNHEAVHDRLYALAERKAKWIKREQERKAGKDEEEINELKRRQLSISRSRKLVMHHVSSTNHSHAGERLYQEAQSDLAKRERQRFTKQKLQQDELTWSCPKCAHVNQYNDLSCTNIVASIAADELKQKKKVTDPILKSDTASLKNNLSTRSNAMDSRTIALVAQYCGQSKPKNMFQPTLLTSSTKSGKKLQHQSKEELKKSTIDRRKRDKQLMEELYRKTFPFQPKINAVSCELVQQRQERLARPETDCEKGKMDIYEALYEHAFEKKAIQEARELEYVKSIPFKPDIGINRHWVTGDENENDFINRLAVTQMKESEQERVKLIEKYSSDRDPETGRPFFSPITGRNPYISRNEESLPIGDYLNAFLRTRAEKQMQNSQAVLAELKDRSNRPHTLRRSQQILAKKKKMAYHELFGVLVSRQMSEKNEVSAKPIKSDELAPGEMENDVSCGTKKTEYLDLRALDTENLPTDLLSIVILLQDSAKQNPISRGTFIALLDGVLSKNLDWTYHKLITALNHVKSSDNALVNLSEQIRDDLNEMTFHPVIDPHSIYLTNKRGRAQKSKIYETLNQYYEHYEQRKLQARKSVENEFAHQFTFQPNINKIKRPSSGFYQKYTNELGGGELCDVSHPHLPSAPTVAHPFVRPINP